MTAQPNFKNSPADTVWRDTVGFCLREAFEFFNPSRWTERHNKIWLDALTGLPGEKIQEGFREYYKSGKHMPKPSEIIALINERVTPASKTRRELSESEPARRCDPMIASAWKIYLRDFMQWPFGNPEIELDHERVLHIVNREAARCEKPGAIRPIDRIEEYWPPNPEDHPDNWWRTNTDWFESKNTKL